MPFLGPDAVKLDNSTMSAFTATLDWHGERLSFSHSSVVIPPTHRTPPGASLSAHSASAPGLQPCSTSSAEYRGRIKVISDTFELVSVQLQGAATIPSRHKGVVCARAPSRPPEDYVVVIESHPVSPAQLRMSNPKNATAYQHATTARPMSTWHARARWYSPISERIPLRNISMSHPT